MSEVPCSLQEYDVLPEDARCFNSLQAVTPESHCYLCSYCKEEEELSWQPREEKSWEPREEQDYTPGVAIHLQEEIESLADGYEPFLEQALRKTAIYQLQEERKNSSPRIYFTGSAPAPSPIDFIYFQNPHPIQLQSQAISEMEQICQGHIDAAEEEEAVEDKLQSIKDKLTCECDECKEEEDCVGHSPIISYDCQDINPEDPCPICNCAGCVERRGSKAGADCPPDCTNCGPEAVPEPSWSPREEVEYECVKDCTPYSCACHSCKAGEAEFNDMVNNNE